MNGIVKYNGYHSVLGDLEVLLVMALRFLYDGLRIFARRKDVVKYTVMFVGCCWDRKSLLHTLHLCSLQMKLIFEFLGRTD